MDKKYEMIPINKTIEGGELLENVVIYLYSRLEECQIETNVDGNTYTILVLPKSKRKSGKTVYITVEMIVHDDFCGVSFTASKARPKFNFAFALAAVPISLPLSGLLACSGLLRLWNHNEFKKELISYIRAYLS